MGEYIYADITGKNLDNPDCAIRLACVGHRFKAPQLHDNKISFAKSFSSVGRSSNTRQLLLKADESRERLYEACKATKISGERVVSQARRFIPLINAILLSCRVQPENARLDEKLEFEWASGIEEKDKLTFFKSEVIMYDLTMAIVCEGLGRAAMATENSVRGEFAAASRDYAVAAGIFDFLASEHLPQWIAKGSNVKDEELPSECHAATARALTELFQANQQQMAVVTLLMKKGKPNYSLLAKLCLGISEQLEDFVSIMRREAIEQMGRMDKEFFTLVAFQINVQKSLSLFFFAHHLWANADYGNAIAIMSEARVALRTRETNTSAGVPDVSRSAPLKPLKQDLKDLREHMATVLQEWETENGRFYFVSVPQKVPPGKMLQEGLKMNKKEAYKLDDVEPVLLAIPERQDSDLAKRLKKRMWFGSIGSS